VDFSAYFEVKQSFIVGIVSCESDNKNGFTSYFSTGRYRQGPVDFVANIMRYFYIINISQDESSSAFDRFHLKVTLSVCYCDLVYPLMIFKFLSLRVTQMKQRVIVVTILCLEIRESCCCFLSLFLVYE
jgi:hypothetical protein